MYLSSSSSAGKDLRLLSYYAMEGFARIFTLGRRIGIKNSGGWSYLSPCIFPFTISTGEARGYIIRANTQWRRTHHVEKFSVPLKKYNEKILKVDTCWWLYSFPKQSSQVKKDSQPTLEKGTHFEQEDSTNRSRIKTTRERNKKNKTFRGKMQKEQN